MEIRWKFYYNLCFPLLVHQYHHRLLLLIVLLVFVLLLLLIVHLLFVLHLLLLVSGSVELLVVLLLIFALFTILLQFLCKPVVQQQLPEMCSYLDLHFFFIYGFWVNKRQSVVQLLVDNFPDCCSFLVLDHITYHIHLDGWVLEHGEVQAVECIEVHFGLLLRNVKWNDSLSDDALLVASRDDFLSQVAALVKVNAVQQINVILEG